MRIGQLNAPVHRGARLLPLLLCLGLVAKGQNLASSNPLVIKAVPQYLVVSGYWVELEQQRSHHPQQSFTLTPQLYLGPAGQPNRAPYYYYWSPEGQRENEKVRGFGLQGQHRFYLKASKTTYPTGWYVSYGPHFQVFQMVYHTRAWQERTDSDGLVYSEYGLVKHTSTINRYGGSVQVGYQAPLLPGRVSLDLYAGVGLRQSYGGAAYRVGTSDYGHRGWYFPGGVKVGLALR
ncbi:hypothetical protein [Hymenobacter cavernae]|uniref:DUF3575 domain-containing protein n=1 Tax=Hymenobacter cavernae TaxID=2044852 RepID=A0ABQ1U7G7_9BACT|nr:hypothetical protein [Hymenobacter cavernae]GGF12035.1 hypothetical protein GCM10011383_24080 [Hymenobacter cavernae]